MAYANHSRASCGRGQLRHEPKVMSNAKSLLVSVELLHVHGSQDVAVSEQGGCHWETAPLGRLVQAKVNKPLPPSDQFIRVNVVDC